MLFSIIGFSNAQKHRVVNSTCPNPNGGQRAHNRLMFFLTLSHMEPERIETGAVSETVSQIRPISDGAICSRLNQIVQNNPKYKSVDQNLNVKRTKYYYRTNNLYYIFWDKKPEFDETISLGPKTLFIVVNKDNWNIWEYYF